MQWVTFVFAGLMAIQRSFLVERENGAWYGLLLCPIDRGAIFVAKMASNVIVLGAAQLVLMALLALLFGGAVLSAPFAALFVNFLGLIGFSALATLFAALRSAGVCCATQATSISQASDSPMPAMGSTLRKPSPPTTRWEMPASVNPTEFVATPDGR